MKRKLLSKEEKRVFEVKVRLNEKEKMRLESMSRVSYNNKAEVIRCLIMKTKVPDPPLSILDIQTYQELRRVGVNYNQYVKAIHQSRISEIDKDIINELYEILQLVKFKLNKV